ncbi:MAG: exopolyphosphatase [Planctomycetota bacterium]|nr:MAG: exopolyphosphatase [Planctomycetota bacterium]
MSPHHADALAAVDLGSNSFHMVIGQLVDGEPQLVDRLREQVQLAAGLKEDKQISAEAQERALACLERFGQRLRELPSSQVRAVGTNTLRAARDTGDFLERAEAALGHPIEIVSGTEEGRLIYLGVAHRLSDDAGTRLVVDIGGGSTECILGERFESSVVHSLYMGCVSWSRRFFGDGVLSAKAMKRAELAARRELKGVARVFRETGWTEAVGSSGTVRTLHAMIRQNNFGDGTLSPESLDAVRDALLSAGKVDKLDIPGLKSERAPVIAGGFAILRACFESLDIQRMKSTSGALREGVVYDLLGRIRHEDVRERTVSRMQERYGVDRAQAARVERCALFLLRKVAQDWSLEADESARLLGWAARMHELGLAVSFRQHHRHGSYLLANSELAGFGREDQRLLAAVVGAQRRKPSAAALELLAAGPRRLQGLRLMVVLRLAVLLTRSRSPTPLPPLDLRAEGSKLVIRAPGSWLDEHPLTQLDLEEEVRQARFGDISLELEISEAG